MTLINWDLVKNPYNWIVVFLMCAFAIVALAIIFPQAHSTEI